MLAWLLLPAVLGHAFLRREHIATGPSSPADAARSFQYTDHTALEYCRILPKLAKKLATSAIFWQTFQRFVRFREKLTREMTAGHEF